VLGDLKVTDAGLSQPEEQVLVHSFALGVEKWCAAHNGLEFRRDTSKTEMRPPGAIFLSGTVTEVDKGNASARFWIGMGAGQQRVCGDFAIHGADGTKLTTFFARKSYLGGQGIGGWDMMKFEELVDQLGQLVAETTDKWARGEKIN
jgi:hypothetical protein